MTDRAQDTEAIRAAISYVLDDVSGAALASDTRVHLARAALGRLVARLEAAEQALRTIAEAELPHAAPPAVAYRDLARAALAAAAPGETTPTEPDA